MKRFIFPILGALVIGILLGAFVPQLSAMSLTSLTSPVSVRNMNYSLSDSTLRVNFKTSKPAAVSIDYGTSEFYGVRTAESAIASEHNVVLTGLLPGKEHHFRVMMKLPDGKVAFSDNFVVKAN